MKNIPQRFTEKDKVWISIMHLVAWVCLKMVNIKGHGGFSVTRFDYNGA